jgi:ribose transport system permease protein
MGVIEEHRTPPRGNGLRWMVGGLGRHFHAYALVVAWAILIIVFSVLRPTEYFTRANFDSLISTQATLLLLAIAFMIPIIIGDLDLSVSGTAGLSLTLVGYLNGLHGWPIVAAALVGIGAAVVVGLVNVILVVGLGVDVIVTTLGVYTVLVGISLGISGAPIGNISIGFTNFLSTSFLGLQVAFWIVIALCLIVWYILSQTPLGRRIFVTGANREVARLSGIRVANLRSLCLMTAAVLGGLAGVLIGGVEGSSDPTVGPSLLFPALAAVFLGSTAITPGRFNVWGTVIGVYFLVFGVAGLEQMGLSGWISQVFNGAALVVAVTLAKVTDPRRRQSARRKPPAAWSRIAMRGRAGDGRPAQQSSEPEEVHD